MELNKSRTKLTIKTTLVLLVMVFIFISLNSCSTCIKGKNEFHSEERILKPFKSVEINQKINITAHLTSPDEKNRIELSAQSNIIPLILTIVENENLIISTSKCIDTTTIIEAHIYCNGSIPLANNNRGVLQYMYTLDCTDSVVESPAK